MKGQSCRKASLQPGRLFSQSLLLYWKAYLSPKVLSSYLSPRMWNSYKPRKQKRATIQLKFLCRPLQALKNICSPGKVGAAALPSFPASITHYPHLKLIMYLIRASLYNREQCREPQAGTILGQKSLHNTTDLHSTNSQAALSWGQSLLIWMQTCRSVAVQIQIQLMEREEGLSLLASVTPVPGSAVTFLTCNLSQIYTCTVTTQHLFQFPYPKRHFFHLLVFQLWAILRRLKTEQEMD